MADIQWYTEVTLDLLWTCMISSYKLILSWLKFFYTPRKDLSGEIVLLTGASGGMGSLLAEKLAKRGCIMILWDINEKDVSELAQRINQIENCKAYSYKCDITDKNEVATVTSDMTSVIGHPTILINNAAIVSGKYYLDLTDDDITRAFEVNTFSHYRLVKLFLPKMLENDHGHIVCISSVLGLQSLAGVSVYGPTKAAAATFMQSLHQEIRCLGRENVYCTTIFPYHVATEMFKGCAVRFSTLPFLNVLCPDYVSSKMVEAIEKNQTILYIPRILYVLIALSTILPVHVYDHLHDFLRTNTAMKTWQGRNGKKEN